MNRNSSPSVNDLWLSHDIPGCSVEVVGDDGWSSKHELDVFCVVSLLSVSSELFALNPFYYDPYCIGISVDKVIGFGFALPSGRVSDVLFV